MKPLVFLLVALLFPLSFYGEESPEGDSAPKTNRLLWKITGNELESPSYLFGTMHQICREDFVFFPRFCKEQFRLVNPLEEKLLETEKLVLEVNTEHPRYSYEIRQIMFIEDNLNLRTILTRNQYDLVSDFFSDSLGVDIERYSHIRPFFLVSEIYPHILGCTPQSYENYLIDKAYKNDIEIGGIESIQDQIVLFENIKLEDEIDELIITIEYYEEIRQELKEMVRLYRKMDLEAFRRVSEGAGEDDIYADAGFITERNLKWIPDMKELMHEKPVFFAFGAAHIPGEKGLINLLRQEGYKVEPVF